MEKSIIVPEWSERSIYFRVGKRFLDIVVALCVIVFLSPLWTSLLIVQFFQFKSIFFVQDRIGLNEVSFRIIKLTSMNPGNEPDHLRITKWGKFLRNSRMDEFPQLFLILVGTMSIVGPRPLIPDYLNKYTQYQRLRHKVKPGIVGLAQIKGSNSISWETQFELDIQYAAQISILKDIQLILLAPTVYFKNHLTTERKAFKSD